MNAMLEKLNERFTLFHVHANNIAPLAAVGGFVVAPVLELSYVRSNLVERRPSLTWYPTAPDFANDPGIPDTRLWFFPFVPEHERRHELVSECVRGVGKLQLLRFWNSTEPILSVKSRFCPGRFDHRLA